ncbi:MAG: P-loop NTPase fold protein [bacterium]|nr:P-loop NTPase fold protein [bacterium]
MWVDDVTDIDFVNFTSVADTVAEVIQRAEGQPVSIGVSGAWGVGKSSMISLIKHSIAKKDLNSKFIFVDFNAWLYQGFDDVRAALLEIIAEKLKDVAEERQTGIDKAKELLARVDWLRVVRATASNAIALSMGMPPMGMLGEAFRRGKAMVSNGVTEDDIDAAGEMAGEISSYLRPKHEESPPQAIHAVRSCFEQTLEELGVTLVVLIDDLDRCLPETTISTLEAIRLFLFLDHTAFVIAADNDMIKNAVRKHFDGVSDQHVTSYFDKLIQVPIGVPPLGTQEVRAYLMLLYVESSDMEDEDKSKIRADVVSQLSKSWQGHRVDRAFMQTLGHQYPAYLVARFDAADRLAPLMTTAEGIKGNPRLIKRFLNALSIRLSLAHSQGVTVEETALTKLLLFERCGDRKAYAELAEAIASSDDGKPLFLSGWEKSASAGEEMDLPPHWDSPFARAWLALAPELSALDLRGALYVSREHTPLITPEDRLSSAGIEILTALLDHPEMAGGLAQDLAGLQHAERSVIFDRVLERARLIQEWGIPDELEACLVLSRSDASLGDRLAAFLGERPAVQLTPAIVQKISMEPWSKTVFKQWQSADPSEEVSRAITRVLKDGNITV